MYNRQDEVDTDLVPANIDGSEKKNVRAWTYDAVENKTSRMISVLLRGWRKSCLLLLGINCSLVVCLLLGQAEAAVVVIHTMVLDCGPRLIVVVRRLLSRDSGLQWC